MRRLPEKKLPESRKTSWKRPSRPKPSHKPTSWIFGRRAALELFESGLEVNEMLLLRSGEGANYERIRSEAESRGISVRFVDRFEFDRLFPNSTHQGVAVSYKPRASESLEAILTRPGGDNGLLVALDGIEDPQNVGAIIRSAEVFGAAGVIIPERRAAGMTPGAVKASAGAALRVPVLSVGNLAQSLRTIKKAGYWVVGLDMKGTVSLFDVKMPTPVCLVLGGEGDGMARLTRDLCDIIVRIPQVGKIGSLNVSATAAIVLAELLRRDQKPCLDG